MSAKYWSYYKIMFILPIIDQQVWLVVIEHDLHIVHGYFVYDLCIVHCYLYMAFS